MYISKKNLKNLPPHPGCYIFKDKNGKILYIGKAKNLKNRIKSYFNRKTDLSPAKQQMLAKIKHLDYISVRSEEEALLLEANLIKKHQPPYNIILKDDKNFLYIKITKGSFPLVTTSRKKTNDGSEYFGPYSSAATVRQNLKIIKRIYPFRSERKNDFLFDVLDYKQDINAKEYQETIKKIKKILNGKTENLERKLWVKMKTASQKQQYEQAAHLRDQINSLKKISAVQQAVLPQPENIDVINWVEFKNHIYLALIKIRQGKLIDKLNFKMNNAHNKPEDVILSFIKQHYLFLKDQPKIILTPYQINLSLPESTTIFKRKITIKKPLRGKFKKLLDLAKLNAEEFAKRSQASFLAARDTETALKNLQKKLSLKKKLKRIECFDISNIQGNYAVGSMVVFTNGLPDKSQYRKFSIKYNKGKINDFAMLAEIVIRRLKHSDWPQADLIILDGGKGQLSTVEKSLNNNGLKHPALIALAKKKEEIFLPGEKKPILLPPHTPEYFLVQRIRDEAHRFAITFYRNKHRKAIFY